ncbi:MAG: AAA family ATPase [Deltaproteobacteria bacterium]|nr:AAA family ATPase [Deltaproteobacteria bacterium]
MQTMQALEEYLKYWGFETHPFMLSPQPSMFYEGGQYFECLQMLRYAVKTQKGGVILVSDEAGLGKTTILLKLIQEMKDTYGETFKFALIEYPLLTTEQMIAQIARELIGNEPYDDKLKNLVAIKEGLSDLFDRGGKCIIVVDEAHMLREYPAILQELRMLINMTYKENYLHTFIISGQKPLWGMLSQMKEFWQRLPVRYYLLPLSLEETRNFLNFRIRKAGCSRDNIYTKDAIALIHRVSGGCPRTILAVSDVSLLVGYSNLANKIGEKEVVKAMEIIGGKGEALPYMNEKVKRVKARKDENKAEEKIELYGKKSEKRFLSKGFVMTLIFLLIPLVLMTLYVHKKNREFRYEIPEPVIIVKEPPSFQVDLSGYQKEEKETKEVKEAVIKVTGANVRVSPSLRSQRIAVLMRDERIEILDEEKDEKGEKWFMIELLGGRYGWVSEKVVKIQ